MLDEMPADGGTHVWIAVLNQAFLDAFAPGPAVSVPEQRDALLFLTATSGAWARSRIDVATIINMDPERVREHALAILEGRTSFDPLGRFVPRIDDARALFEDLHRIDLPPPAEDVGPADAFEVCENGMLYLPRDRPMGRTFRGMALPKEDSFQGRILRALTQKRGATMNALRKAHPRDWADLVKQVCYRLDLELVIMKAGLVVDAIDGETQAFVRPRPRPDA